MARAELWLDGAKAELVLKVSHLPLGTALAWHGRPLMGVLTVISTEKVPLSTSVAGCSLRRTLHQRGCVGDRAEKASGKDGREEKKSQVILGWSFP